MEVACYRFSCRFTDQAQLPPYKGSTFRGAFGAALKKVVCAVRDKNCGRCLLASRCVYARVFEADAGVSPQISRQAAPPHPYVIEPPDDNQTRYQAGDPFNFSLLLFGEFNDYLPYFVYAFESMGEQGLGKGRGRRLGRYRLEQVDSGEEDLYDPVTRRLAPCKTVTVSVAPGTPGSGELHLRLLTPLRLKAENRLTAELPFHLLVRAMLRRISALFACYGDGEPALDYRGLTARARDIEITSASLRWCDWQRYSNRQEQTMLMGGMLGDISYRGAIGEYLPLLEASRMLHLGKQSSFGLGQIDFTWRPEP